MLCVERRPECAPTIALDDAVRAHMVPLRTLDWDLTLRVLPRYTLDPTPDNAHLPKATGLAWYDVVWSITTVHDPADPGSQPIDALNNLADATHVAEDDGVLGLAWIDIAEVGTLPPPPLIPPEQRMGEVNGDGVLVLVQDQIDAMAPAELKFLGGNERAIERLTSMQRVAVASDYSARAYDWTTTAARVIELYTSLKPPKLTAEQRIRAGGARLVKARRAVADAERGQRALVRNAYAAAGGDLPRGTRTNWITWSATTRPTFTTWLDNERDDSDA